MSVDVVNASPEPKTRPGIARFLLPLLAILVSWAYYGYQRLHQFVIHLGSIHEATHEALLLSVGITAIGVPATYLAYRILLRVMTPGSRVMGTVLQIVHKEDQRHVLLVFGVLGALIPLFVRKVVLNEVPLTDDEGSYRFAAEMIASGRLWVPSPQMPVFFDNGFVVNDGKLYSQYFYGWPALLSIGVLLGVPGLINPLLSGLTTVLIGSIAERRLGAAWGRVAALLYICSPFIAVSAATQMSHTSTTFALTLALYAVDRVADHDADWRMSCVAALAVCLAFFTRPATGFGFGAPLVLSWAYAVLRRPSRWKHLLAFIGVAVVPGLLFLWVNEQLTGSPWQTGYHRAFAHAASTGYRFVSFGPQQGNTEKFLFFFVETEIPVIVSKNITVMLRLWHESWGFPFGLALAMIATSAGARRLIGVFIGLLVAHVPLPDAGVDTFGPVHFTELMLPLTLASASGLMRVHHFAKRLNAPGAAPALLAAGVFGSLVFYGTTRFTTLALLAADIRSPIEAFESAPPHSVIFTRTPFAPVCMGRPSSHFVFFRPNNDPDLKNERLWANHINLEADRKFLATRPGWRGYLMRHHRDTCEAELVPLEKANEWEFPPATYLLPGDMGEIPRPR